MKVVHLKRTEHAIFAEHYAPMDNGLLVHVRCFVYPHFISKERKPLGNAWRLTAELERHVYHYGAPIAHYDESIRFSEEGWSGKNSIYLSKDSIGSHNLIVSVQGKQTGAGWGRRKISVPNELAIDLCPLDSSPEPTKLQMQERKVCK